MAAARAATYITGAVLLTIAAVVFASGQWQATVNATLCDHDDHIDLHCGKIEANENRAVELQALYYAQRDRIELLEARVDTLYSRSSIGNQVLMDLYEYQTGQEWSP